MTRIGLHRALSMVFPMTSDTASLTDCRVQRDASAAEAMGAVGSVGATTSANRETEQEMGRRRRAAGHTGFASRATPSLRATRPRSIGARRRRDGVSSIMDITTTILARFIIRWIQAIRARIFALNLAQYARRHAWLAALHLRSAKRARKQQTAKRVFLVICMRVCSRQIPQTSRMEPTLRCQTAVSASTQAVSAGSACGDADRVSETMTPLR